MTDVWRFLRGIPAFAYALAGCVALASLLVAKYYNDVADADAAGYARAIQNTRFDSTLVALVDSGRVRAAVHVDTIRDTVRVRVERVRDVIVRVPDSVRVAVPVVDTLVIESQALVRAVDSLTGALATERAATKVSLDVRDGLIRDARLENARQAAMIIALEKRPTRAQAALFSVGSAAAGAACGRWC